MSIFKNHYISSISLFLKFYTIMSIGYLSCSFATDQETKDSPSFYSNLPSLQVLKRDDAFENARIYFQNLLLQTPILEKVNQDSQLYYEQGQHYQAQNDINLACEWYEKAAVHDHPEALFELGQLKGPLGLPYIKRAAKLNHKIALYHVALIKFSLKDAESGMGLLMKSSELGCAEAQYLNGVSYLGYYQNLMIQKPDEMTIEAYFKELVLAKYRAMNWLMKSALQGYIPAENECNEFLDNNNIPCDMYMTWYANAVQDQGAVSYFNLGLKYLNLSLDHSTPNHFKQLYEDQAIKWLIKSADLNFFSAQYHLICIYEHKQLTTPSLKVSVNNNLIIKNKKHLKYLIKVANQDINFVEKTHINAREAILTSIKKLVDHHLALEQYEVSMRWLHKAAALEDVEALYNLGIYYHEGSITAPNQELAKVFYNKAIRLGDPDAASKLRELLAESSKTTEISKISQ